MDRVYDLKDLIVDYKLQYVTGGVIGANQLIRLVNNLVFDLSADRKVVWKWQISQILEGFKNAYTDDKYIYVEVKSPEIGERKYTLPLNLIIKRELERLSEESH